MASIEIEFEPTLTGKVLGDFTVSFCKNLAGDAVSQVGMTLTEIGNGVYVLTNANVTVDTVFRLALTSDTNKYVVGKFSVSDGDIALQSKLGSPSNLGSGATVAANLVDIESQTDDIGAAGAGLTAVPWNAAWDAEVESEVTDSIVAHNLDHLMKTAVANNADLTTEVVDGTVLANILAKDSGDTSDFNPTTDSLEAIRDRGDAAWITATGFSTHSAADVKTAIEAAGSSLAQILEDTGTTLPTTLATIAGYLDTEIAAILADTDELELDWKNGGRLDLILDAVKAVTDALTAAAAAKLALSAGTIVSGAAAAGTLSTTQMTTNMTEETNDHYNGRIIIWTSGVLQNQATNITDYDGASKMLTFTAVTEAPTALDTFIIV